MSTTVRVMAPAKVNLHLNIGGKREDGYHDVRTVMHALTLHDVITMRFDSEVPAGVGRMIDVTCESRPGIADLSIPAQDNLVYKAVVRLADELGGHDDEIISVTIDKAIPHAAGMGGGSSDAAAALVGACEAWDVPVSDPRVEAVARSLGADVAFFLRGGCAVLGDRGDVLERTLTPMNKTLVLVRPDLGVSTGAAYAAFDAAERACAYGANANVDAAQAAEDVSLFNNLAPAVEGLEPELARVREWLAARDGVAKDQVTGEPQVLMCGSGSTTFAIFDNMAAALATVSAAKLEGWWARTSAFTSARAMVLPDQSQAQRSNLGAQKRAW